MLIGDEVQSREDTSPPRAVRWFWALDRTAVLIVGIVAGFVVGISFSGTPTQQSPIAAVPAPTAPTKVIDSKIDPRVVARVARTGKITVGVFGDSYGVGVWDALYRLLPSSQGYEVLKFSQEATGFSRYRVTNLEQKAKAQVAADPIDVAVISMGVNDAHDMWDGKLYPFMSPSWKQVIGARLDRFVAVARSTGARVYWIGLPAMRDPALDAKVQALNTFFAAHMARLGVTFIDTRPLSVDARGQYASHLPDSKSGALELMRTQDGIHMIGIGYQRIVASAVRKIRAYSARVRAAAHRPVPSETPS